MLVLFHIILEIPLLSFTHSTRAHTECTIFEWLNAHHVPFFWMPPCPLFRLQETLISWQDFYKLCFRTNHFLYSHIQASVLWYSMNIYWIKYVLTIKSCTISWQVIKKSKMKYQALVRGHGFAHFWDFCWFQRNVLSITDDLLSWKYTLIGYEENIISSKAG